MRATLDQYTDPDLENLPYLTKHESINLENAIQIKQDAETAKKVVGTGNETGYKVMKLYHDIATSKLSNASKTYIIEELNTAISKLIDRSYAYTKL